MLSKMLLAKTSGLRWFTAGAWAATVVCWLLYALQHPVPVGVGRLLVFAAVTSTGLLGFAACAKAWVSGRRLETITLVAIACLSITFHTLGIEHEIHDSYYHDEGTYRQHADSINRGELVGVNYIYPHLVFYIDAYTTWTASLFYPAILTVSDQLFGVADWTTFCRLLARFWSAFLAGLAAVPAFFLAARFAGTGAGFMAGGLVACSSVFAEGAHVHTNDIPATFFVMLTLAIVGRLVDEERTRDYLLAGMCAGLAAGSKYPAGLVAIAIFAVWIKWRFETRKFSFSLGWSGLTALSVFVVTTPGLVLFPHQAFSAEKTGVFGGFYQYSGAAWIGVSKESNTLYYLDLLVTNFGVVAFVAGAVGLFASPSVVRRRLVWLLPFPVLFIGLMISMKVAVERNIFPVIPPFASLLAVGIAIFGDLLVARLPYRSPLIRAGLFASCILLPLGSTIVRDVAFKRSSTRDLMNVWIEGNLPRGARVLKEVYTPSVSRQGFQVFDTFWVGSYSVANLHEQKLDFILLADEAFDRFLDRSRHFLDEHEEIRSHYERFFSEFELVKRFDRNRFRRGPKVMLFRVPPVGLSDGVETIEVAEAFDAVHPPGGFEPFDIGRSAARSIPVRTYRLIVPRGAYSFEISALEKPVAIRVVASDNSVLVAGWIDNPWSFPVEIEESGLYYLQVYLHQNRRSEPPGLLSIRKRPRTASGLAASG